MESKKVTKKSDCGKYVLYANTELWTTGKHAFMCGYVMDPENMDTAIDTHEEEMRCLIADAREEFGP